MFQPKHISELFIISSLPIHHWNPLDLQISFLFTKNFTLRPGAMFKFPLLAHAISLFFGFMFLFRYFRYLCFPCIFLTFSCIFVSLTILLALEKFFSYRPLKRSFFSIFYVYCRRQTSLFVSTDACFSSATRGGNIKISFEILFLHKRYSHLTVSFRPIFCIAALE